MIGVPDSSSTTIVPRVEDAGVVIKVEGPINENFDRAKFIASSSQKIVIVDLDAVPWITSFGVREWVNAIKAIPNTYLAFINIRPIVLQQFNMVASFAGEGELLSFYAPYTCPQCNHCQECLIDLLELYPKVKQLDLPVVLCDQCKTPSELDELAENYLMYVSSARRPDPPPEYWAVLKGEPLKTPTHLPLKLEKLVEDKATLLLLSGELNGRASLKRALAGLEGTVAVSFTGIQTYNREGIERLRPLWEETAAEVLLIGVPFPLAAALPVAVWQRMKILSLLTELHCARGHVLKRALLQNHEIWRLARGEDPLRCPSCNGPLIASGIDLLASRNAFGNPTLETLQTVTQMLDWRQRRKPQQPEVSEPFGRYKLVELLGMGGMAEVYLASQVGMAGFEKSVVLKRILPHLARDRQFIDMFLQEARLAARISHPNVVQIYDVGQIQQTHYIAMEFVPGWDLSRLLQYATRLSRPFPHHLAARVCADIASALDAAHTAMSPEGKPTVIIHRDVSPHNVLISREGAVKLTDFGIAKALENGVLTPTVTIKGKLEYMAPELARGVSSGVGADIFPIGVILYQLIALVRLFRRNSDYATMHALLHDPIPELRSLAPNVPEALDLIAKRTLARDPSHRYQSARALRDDLENYVRASEVSASSLALGQYVNQIVTDAVHLKASELAKAKEDQITVEDVHSLLTERDP